MAKELKITQRMIDKAISKFKGTRYSRKLTSKKELRKLLKKLK